ncbi:site-2 protease family protein [Solibacillus sp. FSL W8-0372]|uniref:site-2 protease family protein n=1 Tax=Solibacillus sp. FSL W8-0372 TaxID=2921713 RepID=UPI0030D40D58
MQFIKSPLGVTILFSLVALGFQLTAFADTFQTIWLFSVLAIATFFIHELGHALFAVAAGYQFNFLTAGPITIERNKISANKSWAFFGGVASCLPKTDDLQIIRRQHLWFAAGGPIISLIVGSGSLILSYIFDLQIILFFGMLNIVIFLVTAIPFNGGMKSDGRVILELLSDKDQNQFVSSLILMKEMMTPVHPTSWSSNLVEQARTVQPSEENISTSYLLFYYDLLKHDYETASKAITEYKSIPVTKKNKMTMQFITHIKQLDLVMLGHTAALEEMRELHKMMAPIEPISYKRSEWMIAKLSGNEALASKKLAEHRKQIEQGKSQFGFFYAEERLTDLVEEKLK